MAEQKESLYAMRRRKLAEGAAAAAAEQSADSQKTEGSENIDRSVDPSQDRTGHVMDLTPDPAVIGASDEIGPEQASEPWRKFYAAVREATERMRE